MQFESVCICTEVLQNARYGSFWSTKTIRMSEKCPTEIYPHAEREKVFDSLNTSLGWANPQNLQLRVTYDLGRAKPPKFSACEGGERKSPKIKSHIKHCVLGTAVPF